MLDFSFSELLLVVVVAVVFLRPKDVPVVVRACAKIMAQFKALTAELRGAFDDLARESGVEQVKKEMRVITGDDGKPYEAYDLDDFIKPADGTHPRKS